MSSAILPSQSGPREAMPDSERRVLEAAANLGSGWVVYHQLDIHSVDRSGAGHDGEIDFVVAHPDVGVLVLEVKGGGLGYDAPSGSWVSQDRFGKRNRIKDPFWQAQQNKYALRALLEKQARGRIPWLLGHAVAVPDLDREEVPNRPNAPDGLIVDRRDLVDLAGALRRAAGHWQGEPPRFDVPGGMGMQMLRDLFEKSYEISTTIGLSIRNSEEEIVRLTEQQFHLLRTFQRQNRIAVAGCAGAGKTMLAMEQARRLMEQGLDVLVTCFNVPLGEELARRAERIRGEGSIHAVHYHRLAWQLAEEAGIELPTYSGPPPAKYFDSVLPEAMLEAASQLGPRFDAILVDEAQDFKEAYWTSLLVHHRDPDHGHLHLFHDDNQSIYDRSNSLPAGLSPVDLTQNCRNTQPIFEVVRSFHDGEMEGSGVDGPPVQRLAAETAAEIVGQCRKVLHRLVHEDGMTAEDIVILTVRRAEDSVVMEAGKLGNFRLSTELPPPAGEVAVSSVHKFKGLERPVVVLVASEPGHETRARWDELMYVGASRARGYLVIVGGSEALHISRS